MHAHTSAAGLVFFSCVLALAAHAELPSTQALEKTRRALDAVKKESAEIDAVTGAATDEKREETPPPPPADPAKTFLTGYIAIGTALAADDLAATKRAAAALPEAAMIASAANLGTARRGFAILSNKALSLAKGRTDLQIVFCSMYPPKGASWVQPAGEIANPYFGASMLRCGEIKK